MSFPGPNLVFTLDRKGPAFAAFFTALFESMRDAEDMLLACAIGADGNERQS